MTSLRLRPTADGSLACEDESAGEWTHNRAGAMTEAHLNYALPADLPGWLQQTASAPRPLVVFDACFGLGYNTWALVLAMVRLAPSHPVSIHVIGIEQNPEMLSLIPDSFQFPMLEPLKPVLEALEHNIYYQTLLVGQNSPVIHVANVRLTLSIHVADLRAVMAHVRRQGQWAGVSQADLVFHDAYSPPRMPELWTQDLFETYHSLLAAYQGRCVTYSAAAAVRGGMQAAGFSLWRTAALGQKTGGTLASVSSAIALPPEAGLGALSPWERDTLASRSGLPYRDPTLSAPRAAILQQRAEALAQSSRPTRPAQRA